MSDTRCMTRFDAKAQFENRNRVWLMHVLSATHAIRNFEVTAQACVAYISWLIDRECFKWCAHVTKTISMHKCTIQVSVRHVNQTIANFPSFLSWLGGTCPKHGQATKGDLVSIEREAAGRREEKEKEVLPKERKGPLLWNGNKSKDRQWQQTRCDQDQEKKDQESKRLSRASATLWWQLRCGTSKRQTIWRDRREQRLFEENDERGSVSFAVPPR